FSTSHAARSRRLARRPLMRRIGSPFAVPRSVRTSTESVCFSGLRHTNSSSLSEAHQELPHVLAPIEARNRTGRRVQPVENLLTVPKRPVADAIRQEADGLGTLVLVVERQEPRHARALRQEDPFYPRALRRRVPTRDRRGAAHHNPRANVQSTHHGVTDA